MHNIFVDVCPWRMMFLHRLMGPMFFLDSAEWRCEKGIGPPISHDSFRFPGCSRKSISIDATAFLPNE
jgi:hypothetical protein